MEILVGTNKATNGGGGRYYHVEYFKMHDEYDRRMRMNDIAVIRVLGQIDFNEKVQPIEMLPDEVADGTDVQLAGWGKTNVSSQKQILFKESQIYFIIL